MTADTGTEIVLREIAHPGDRGGWRDFIQLPFRLYRDDPNWVPPLLRDMWEMVRSPRSLAVQAGPMLGLVAYRDGQAVGRLLCSINHHLNQVKQRKLGYFSLFECEEDLAVAGALLERAESWLRDLGMATIRGPFSPTYGDDYRGLLVQGFEGPPVVMDSYNPAYYEDLLSRLGYRKDYDFLAFRYLPENIPERLTRVSEHAMRRYGFSVRGLRMNRFDQELLEFKAIMDRSTPDEWRDVVLPTLAEVRETARRLRPLAVPDLCAVARSSSGDPIGFVIGMPNYNEILKDLGGRLWPLGWLKFLLRRRQIRGVRVFVLFVVPEWRRKAVTGAMFLHILRACERLGYTWAEGSTAEDINEPVIREALGAGGEHYRTFRLLSKPLGTVEGKPWTVSG